VLFAGWFFLLGWLLGRSSFVRSSGIPVWWIWWLFGLKVAGGVLFGWVTQNNTYTDTWRYHADGLLEYQLLFSDPWSYLTNIFHSEYPDRYAGIFRSHDSYWNDLRANLMIKLHSILDIFSGGRYYVNVVLYNFIVFFGFAALYRFCMEVFKAGRLMTTLSVFCLPSVWIYGSALHKEGILLACMGFFLFGIHQWLINREKRHWVFIFLSLTLIFLFRPYIVAALIPALIAFILSQQLPGIPRIRVYALVYGMGLLLFFLLPLLLPTLDFPAIVAQKQSAFLELETARTALPLMPLEPGFSGFVYQLPTAVQHVFLRPWLADLRMSVLLLPHIVEWTAYLIIFLLSLRLPKKPFLANLNFCWMLAFFTITVWLFIGYTVPVLGAIIRYRTVFLPLLMTPLLSRVNWDKVAGLFKIKK